MNVTRWGAYIYIMICLAISVNLQAQEKHAPLQKQVRITNTSFSIDSLSRLISRQTGVFLSFNSNKVAAGKKIATQKRLYTLEELLELIKSSTGSSYKIYQDHVIFHRNDKQASIKTASVTLAKVKLNTQKTGPETDKTKPEARSTGNLATKSAQLSTASLNGTRSSGLSETKQSNPSLETKQPKPSEAKQPTAAAATQPLSNQNEPKAPLAITSISLEPIKTKAQKPPITLIQQPSLTTQRPPASPRIPATRWFADGGFTVDDVLYLNPSITAGHQYLHGFFSWSSSFKVSGFRYGLGSMIPVNDEWRIGLLVTTGKLNRNIDFTGVRDTLKNITVKSELHRAAIQVEKSLRPHLIVKAGPVFNLLKSSYYQEGKPVTVATSGYEGPNADRELYTVRPLYTLSNSYKTTTPDNTKTWIGFQVSLCYRFNF